MRDERGLAQLLDIPVGVVRTWRRMGVGPLPVRLGSRWVYLEPDVTAWLDSGGARDCGIALPLSLGRVADDPPVAVLPDRDGEQVGA